MKRLFYFCIAIFAILLFGQSCSKNTDNSKLVAIDSLILQNPDSACELLAAYPADSLTNDEARAYYALLLTIADYKAYHPATTDSVINIAVCYYDHRNADSDKRMRSLLYNGCVMEELGNDKQAMRYYKRAQYACPDKDFFHNGYISFRIASLYQRNAEVEQAILNFKNASNFFSDNQLTIYYRTCIRSLGALYRGNSNDSALYYINRGIELSKQADDKSGELSGIVNLSGYYFNIDDFAKAKDIAVTVLNNKDKDLLYDMYVYYFACMSFVRLGNADSAQVVLDMMPQPSVAVDSMQYYRCKAEILKSRNELNEEYHRSLDIAESLEDSLIQKPYDNGLVAIANEIDKEHIVQSGHKKVLIAIVCIFVIVVIALYFYFSQKKYQRLSVQLSNEVSSLNNEIVEALTRVETIKEHGLDDSTKINKILKSIDESLSCYSSIMARYIDRESINSGKKNEKVVRYMDDRFFDQLRRFVNLRYDNLVEKLKSPEFKFSEEEINIICLDLCKFPPSVVWTYSRFERLHSIFNKKSKIAAKAHCRSISEIPDKIK